MAFYVFSGNVFFPQRVFLSWLDHYSILHLFAKVASFTFIFYATRCGWNMKFNVAFVFYDISMLLWIIHTILLSSY